VLRGRKLAAEDQRVLTAFAAQVAVAYQQRRLAEAAAAAETVAEVDRTRTALLNAVSHDLRTPIASAKAAVSSLRSADVDWSEADRQELLATAESALDRLTALVTNLLDLSRLQAGVLSVTPRTVSIEDVISRALDYAALDSPVLIDVPPTLPEVRADPGLLERVIANLVENAVRYTPAGQPVRLVAGTVGDTVELRVTDRGPGIPPDERDSVFAPFQRRDDRATSISGGVGLGLAIARGFIQARHGTLTLDDTPGGGLTAVITLPMVSAAPPNIPAAQLTVDQLGS
jgi:two-component system sensor histidine kinase KdpD